MATPELVVDTDILVDDVRWGTNALEIAFVRYNCVMTAISLYELRAGLRHSERQVDVVQRLQRVMDVLPFGPQAAEQAAHIWQLLSTQGHAIGLPDTLIAGTCLAEKLPLLTRNTRHFERVPGLVVLDPVDLTER